MVLRYLVKTGIQDNIEVVVRGIGFSASINYFCLAGNFSRGLHAPSKRLRWDRHCSA